MTFRAFVSVDIGDGIDWHSLRKELADVDRGVRPVKTEQLHLTLRFLGDMDEALLDDLEGQMNRAVEDVSPFLLTFHGVGAFPNARKPRVVWIGLEGAEPLSVIAERLEKGAVELGFVPEKRGFRPHATVARIKNVRRSGSLASLLERWKDESFGSMEVDSIHLKSSKLTPQGAIHATVHTSRLLF